MAACPNFFGATALLPPPNPLLVLPTGTWVGGPGGQITVTLIFVPEMDEVKYPPVADFSASDNVGTWACTNRIMTDEHTLTLEMTGVGQPAGSINFDYIRRLVHLATLTTGYYDTFRDLVVTKVP